MNMNGVQAAPPLWQEARTAEGRVYYYNTQTKATQWTKPLELMTPLERSLANQPWKEYTTDGGRKYWYNTETRESSWSMPQVYKDALAQHAPPPRPAAPTFVAGGTSTLPPTAPRSERERERDDYHADRRHGHGHGHDFMPADMNGAAVSASVPVAAQDEPNFGSYEDAESAFMKMLRRYDVQSDWTWEKVIRTTIKDPQYRSIKDPKDRQLAFEKYASESRAHEQEKAKERLAKLRDDFGKMLRSHPEIKYYSRWKTIRPIIEGETIFRSTNSEEERRQLFGEYILELRKEHMEQEAASRKVAKERLAHLLKSLNLEPYTRWLEAQDLIQKEEDMQNDKEMKTLTRSDILTAFEGHIKALERTFNDTRQQQKYHKARRERHNREAFVALLQELRSEGKLRAGTKWMDALPLFEKDPRYTAMLGQSGSTPLNLFWDVIEEEERALRGPRNDVLDVLDDKRYEMTPKTTYEEFNQVMTSDRRTSKIDSDILHLLFDRLKEKVIKRSEDEKHAADRHERRAIDALRSRIKHLEPPVRVTDTWDQVKPRVEKTDEYRALESEESRIAAFDKVIRRLKEKEEDIEKDRASRRDHDRIDRRATAGERGSASGSGVDRDRERERDRDYRYRPDRKSSGRFVSRSPEPDPYEADRRKAQADRERNYRRSSIYSPPTRDRRDDREERDRERERERERDRERERERDIRIRERERRHSRYDREREHRDLDRDEYDRFYRSRADPRSRGEELDYGGDSAVTTPTFPSERRKRRDSEATSVASRKRSKREETAPVAEKAKTEKAGEVKEGGGKEDATVHSGSEEGEIEED
ncbi:hypothetical protein KEM56_005100 [Ascosphaera pollenicola]|nr:hypothetical protein KEM56_005100 [Ascosphaera pollenicola]